MNELKFNIIANTFGSEKVNELRQRLGLLGNGATSLNSKLVGAASGTYLFTKAIELGTHAISSFRQVIDMADDLNDLSTITGISATKLSGFSEAAKQSGMSTEDLQRNVKKLNMNLGDPNNEKFTDALKALGISTIDANGKLKSTDAVLSAITDRFAKMEDGPKKAAFANSVFGKSGSDMIPLLNMGSKAIDDLGFKMSNDFPAAADRFNDSIETTKKLFKEQQASFLSDFLPTFQGAIDAYNAVQKNSDKSFGSVGADLGNIAKGLAGVLNSVVTRLISVGDIFGTVIVDIFSGIKTVVQEILTGIGAIGRAMVSVVKGDFKNALSGFSAIGDASKQDAVNRRERYSNMWSRVQERGANEELYWHLLNGGYEEQSPRAPKRKGNGGPSVPNKKYEKESESLAKYALAQSESINLERQRIDNFALSATELKKLNIAQEIHSQAVKDTVGWEQSSRDAYMATAEAVIHQKQALVDLEQQQRETYSVGAKQALRDYVDKIKDVATQTKELFTGAFQHMEDALVNFVKTGKLNFSDFADAVISDMIRIAVRQATLGILVSVGMASFSPSQNSASSGSGYLGANTSFSANGNVVSASGVMPLSRFAKGGVVNSPHVAVFGEAGPEAFVPLPDGRRIPVEMSGSGSGGVSVVVNVNVATGEEKVTGNNEAMAIGKMISAAVKTEILNQKRPGGILS